MAFEWMDVNAHIEAVATERSLYSVRGHLFHPDMEENDQPIATMLSREESEAFWTDVAGFDRFIAARTLAQAARSIPIAPSKPPHSLPDERRLDDAGGHWLTGSAS